MRQHTDKDSRYLLCLECGRGYWEKWGTSNSQHPTANAQLPQCKFCGGETVVRKPLLLALTEIDRRMLNFIAHHGGKSPASGQAHSGVAAGALPPHSIKLGLTLDEAAARAIRTEFRLVAIERAQRVGKLPQWVAEALQNISTTDEHR